MRLHVAGASTFGCLEPIPFNLRSARAVRVLIGTRPAGEALRHNQQLKRANLAPNGLLKAELFLRHEPNRILRPLSLNPEFVAYKELRALLKQFVTELHPRFSVLAKHADFPQKPVWS